MRTKLFLAAGLAALLGGLAAAAGAAPRGITYSFLGKLTATPSGGHVSIGVEAGSPAALRAMLGQPVEQTFSYGDKTEFLQWTGGVPKIVEAGDLHAGDYVRVNVRAPRGSSLATIESTDAFLVGDHGTELTRPEKPEYLFRGQVASVGSSSVTLTVRGGNLRALRLMRGQPATQTFTVGNSTIYLLWQGKAPSVISLTDLKTGDRVAVHVRADAGSTLAQVEAAAAAKVAEHEPGV
jgi:uncharacterized protein DUF5666